MLRHYVTVVFRHKVYSGIVVIGLALASCLLIAGYVDNVVQHSPTYQRNWRPKSAGRFGSLDSVSMVWDILRLVLLAALMANHLLVPHPAMVSHLCFPD